MIIGIDPGVGGAIAFLQAGSQARVADMPIEAKDYGKKGNQVNARELLTLLNPTFPVSVVALERVNAMPNQGVTSVFGFGRSFGVIECAVIARGWKLVYVRPQAWKKHFGLLKKGKDASRTKALQLYPSMADRLARKKDSDRADAILIAEYAKSLG